MLAEHLSQAHDAASRRLPKIEEQVNWIHSQVLGGRRTRLLDLYCGPGLYTSRLAALGHECVGIDFSPAAITYAKEQARAQGIPGHYLHEDVRRAEFGSGFGLVMMLFGQFNVFNCDAARALLAKARRALTDDGILLLEAHTLAAVEHIGAAGTSWYSSEKGLFSPQPHLVLQENFWDAATKAATTRFFVIDAASGQVTRHTMTTQGYSDDDSTGLLSEAGFTDIQYFPALTGVADSSQKDFLVLMARNRNSEK